MPLGLSWQVGRLLSGRKEKERAGLQSCKTNHFLAVSLYKCSRVALAQFSLVMAAVILFASVVCASGCRKAVLLSSEQCAFAHTRAHCCRAGSAGLLVTQLRSTVYRSQLCKRLLLLQLALCAYITAPFLL